jgi:hypothetical protein
MRKPKPAELAGERFTFKEPAGSDSGGFLTAYCSFFFTPFF